LDDPLANPMEGIYRGYMGLMGLSNTHSNITHQWLLLQIGIMTYQKKIKENIRKLKRPKCVYISIKKIVHVDPYKKEVE